MPVMNLTIADGVAEITMTNGENRHNPTYLAEINQALDSVLADPGCQAVILASDDPKFWSLGMDLDWIMASAVDPTRQADLRAFLHGMNDLYRRFLSFPMPVIAAIGGHAFGNGAILSCSCDFRFMRSDRGFFCFPEVDVNIPFLPGMFAVVKKSVPAYLLNELALSGRRLSGAEALEHHVVQGVFEGPEAFREGVLRFAKGFKKGRAIVREQKIRNYNWIFEIIERDDPALIDSLTLVV